MANTETPAVVVGGAYKESDDHVPSPTDQYGVVDTSGTAGIGDQRIEDITPVFDVAKNQAKLDAARALDPDDDGVDASLVTLPQGQVMQMVDPEKERERIVALADAVKPIEVGGPSASQRAAAEGDDDAKEAQEIDAKEKPAQKKTTAQTFTPTGG